MRFRISSECIFSQRKMDDQYHSARRHLHQLLPHARLGLGGGVLYLDTRTPHDGGLIQALQLLHLRVLARCFVTILDLSNHDIVRLYCAVKNEFVGIRV